MNKTINRLKQYIDFKGIKHGTFDREIGASNGYISKIIKSNGSIGSDFLEKISTIYIDLNPYWLITGRGQMIISNEKPTLTYDQENVKFSQLQESELEVYANRTDRLIVEQKIPVYDGTVTAGNVPVLDNINSLEPLDYIYIPNAPKCDGAIYAFGDSMYPLIKSGDLLAYKIIHDIKNDVFYGHKFILYIQTKDDIQRTIKYVKKIEGEPDYIRLVSENRHHGDKDVHISKVKAIAQVKITVRID